MKISYSESSRQSAALMAQAASQLHLTRYSRLDSQRFVLHVPSTLHFYHCIRRQHPLYLLDRSLRGSQDRFRLNASVNRKAVELGFLQISLRNLVVISVPYCRYMSLAKFEIFFSVLYLQIP
jgi:hypothetical protein